MICGSVQITAEVLQSLAGVYVVAERYALANTSWVQYAAEAVTPGSTLYTLLGKGGTAGPWNYVVLQVRLAFGTSIHDAL